MIGAILPFLVIGIMAAPWFLLIRERSGHIIAALAVSVSAPLMVLGTFTASFLLGTDPVLLTLGTATVAGATGVVLLRRRRTRVRRPSRLAVATLAGASLGGVLWLAALVVARILPGSAALGWSMRGDSANQIHTTRDMFAWHGFLLGTGNPVPLQNELLTIAAWTGRPDSPAGAVVLHDVQALAVVWALAIGAMGLVMGVIASSLLARPTPVLAIVASAGISLLTTTWFFTGLPIDSGYFNVHVALPFVLAGWLAYLQHPRQPIAASLILLGCGVLLLASWSPLVVFPLALLGAIARRNWARVREARSRAAVAVMIALVLFAGVLALLYSPKLFDGLGSLSSPGHGYPLTIVLMTAAVLATLIALAFLRRRVETVLRDGVIALGLAAGSGLAALIFISRYETIPWLTYYPTKFTWLATVVILIVLLSQIFALLSYTRSERGRTFAVAVVSVVALVTATMGPAPDREDFRIVQPFSELIGGDVWTGGEASLSRIVTNLNSDNTVVLWKSEVLGEGFINFWVLDFSGASATDSNGYVRTFSVRSYRALRDTGTAVPADGVAFLCGLPEHLERPLTVQTRDSSLGTNIAAACPTSPITIELLPAASGGE